MVGNNVILEKKDKVAQIKMNCPKTMNALTDVLFAELAEATDDVIADETINVVVITGMDNAFCAGGDLKRLGKGFGVEEGYDYMKGFHSWVTKFTNMGKITIAAVNGFAMGAGFCIALMCDLVIASEKARFGMAFAGVGLIPDLSGMYTLPRLVGLQKAKELVFTGKRVSAKEGEQLGFVNAVCEEDKLADTVLTIANELANGPMVALRMAKRVMNQSPNLTLEQLLELEAQAQTICFQSKDHELAVKAFFNKEKPVFTGK